MKELVLKCHSEVKEGKGRGMCDVSGDKSRDWDEGQWSQRGGHLCREKNWRNSAPSGDITRTQSRGWEALARLLEWGSFCYIKFWEFGQCRGAGISRDLMGREFQVPGKEIALFRFSHPFSSALGRSHLEFCT